MKIYIKKDCEMYSVHCGQIVDTSDPNSHITDIQATALCMTNYATTDLDEMDTRNLKYDENKEYDCNAVMVKDNCLWQLKENTTASTPFNTNEWDLILQGA